MLTKLKTEKSKENIKPCNCKAYKFPHRKYGGKCMTNENEFRQVPTDKYNGLEYSVYVGTY